MLPLDVRDRATPPDALVPDEVESLSARMAPRDAERLRALVERGRRYETRLQLLQQVAGSLARTLDEDEILVELARAVRRAVACEGVMVARVDLDRALVEVIHHGVGDAVLAPRVAPLGAGPLGEAARSGTPVHVAAYDPDRSPLAAADDVLGEGVIAGSVLAVPVMHGRRLLGVVALHDPREEAFDREAREVTAMIARHAAGALSNARLFAESERERRQSEAMAEIARAVGESLKMGEVLRLILRHAVALLQAEGACVALREGDYLHVVSALGSTELMSGVHMPVAGSLSGRVVTDGMAIVTNDITAEQGVHRPTLRLVPIRKSVIVPLMTARGILGIIAVYDRGADFTTDDARVLQRLADQVAVAVVNARLYEEVRDATREWSAAFDSIGLGMCLVDDDRRITRSNSRALQLTVDDSLRVLLGRPFHETILGVLPDADGDPLARAIDDGVQSRAVCEGSNGRWLDILAVPHPNGGAIVTFDDVSAQRAAWDRHRHIVEATPCALCTLDLEGRVLHANPAARDLIGRDDLIGVRWSDLVAPEGTAAARAQVQQAADGAPQRHECALVRGDGEQRLVSLALAHVREHGQVTMLVASLHDITGERRARRAVTGSEARYRLLFESATDAVVTLNLTGAITSANPAACDAFDAPGDVLLGRSLHPLVAPADVDGVVASLCDVREGESRQFECQIVRRNGATRQLHVAATPMREGRAVVGTLLVARDVTEERARAGVLRRSEARYAQLVETASDAIFTVDEEGNFTSVNRAFEAATGQGRDVVAGQHFTSLLDPRDREIIWELFVAALHGHRGAREVRYLDGAGRSRWGSLVASPIVEEGRVTGVMGVVRDVTAEKRLLDELLRRERLASVGQLLGGVAHELNDPLSAVLAFSELLLESPADDRRAQEGLVTIREEAQRASRMLRNLLELTRERPAHRAPLRLAEVVANALAVRRYALGVAGVTIDEELPNDLPATYGDAGRLQQAVLHLLTRAEHSLRGWGGEKRLSLHLSRISHSLVLVVRDTGPGIAAAELERIFSPRIPSRDGADLAGLGLAVAEGIVREHGGRIHVDSTPGDGASFVVEIPIVSAPDEEEAPPPGPSSEEAGTSLDVLVIDDEPTIRAALKRLIESLGHRVALAADGEEGRLAIAGAHFDRILLDLRMPRLGGAALLTELRERRPELVSRVIILTGDVAVEDADAIVRECGCLTLHKPFALDDVRQALAATPSTR